MSTQKRERDLARAKYERQQAKRSERAQHAKRNQRITAVVVVLALVIAGVGFTVFNATNEDPAVLAESSESSESSEAGVEAVALDCAPIGTPRPNDITYPDGPVPLGSTPTTLTLDTTCGQIVIALDANAQKTVESEAFLADSGFYNNTSCHRLTTEGIFVLQCGDPAGDGTGGPGYSVPDENLPAQGEANYPAGTIAMANAGPGTSGSQFFIVYADTTLPGDYSIWGKVTSGLDIVQEVASVGVKGGLADGVPAQPVFINTATVS